MSDNKRDCDLIIRDCIDYGLDREYDYLMTGEKKDVLNRFDELCEAVQEVERMRTAIQYALDNQPYMATRTVEVCNELRQALKEQRQ